VPVGQRLQGDQRSLDRVGIVAMQVGAAGPLLPKPDGLLQGLLGIGGRRKFVVRRSIAQNEVQRVACADGEFADRLQVFAARSCAGVKHRHIRAGYGAKHSVFQAGHPRNRAPIVEAQGQFHAQIDLAANAANNSDQVGRAAAQRHKVEQQS
jgi:hypothetical protein